MKSVALYFVALAAIAVVALFVGYFVAGVVTPLVLVSVLGGFFAMMFMVVVLAWAGERRHFPLVAVMFVLLGLFAWRGAYDAVHALLTAVW